jgi:gamma-glutamyltranspeptidase
LPDGSAEVIDARETAPQKAHKTMFRGRPDLSLRGGKAIAVPLELQGLYLAHSRHGSLKWTEVLTPAIELAENGFPAHPYLISALQSANFSVCFQTRCRNCDTVVKLLLFFLLDVWV